MVHLHRLTKVGEPKQKPGTVQTFLLSCAFILDHICRHPVCHPGHHSMKVTTPPVLQLPSLASKGIQLYQYTVSGLQLYGPFLTSYSGFCCRASFRAESCAIFTDFRRCLYSILTYSSKVHVRLCSQQVGNKSIGSQGLGPNI